MLYSCEIKLYLYLFLSDFTTRLRLSFCRILFFFVLYFYIILSLLMDVVYFYQLTEQTFIWVSIDSGSLKILISALNVGCCFGTCILFMYMVMNGTFVHQFWMLNIIVPQKNWLKVLLPHHSPVYFFAMLTQLTFLI